jgi:hypothetical protein
MEAPAGEKDMGSYVIGVYTAEQQVRLNVDAEGTKIAKPVAASEPAFLCIIGKKFYSVAEFAQEYSTKKSDLPIFIIGKTHNLISVGYFKQYSCACVRACVCAMCAQECVIVCAISCVIVCAISCVHVLMYAAFPLSCTW